MNITINGEQTQLEEGLSLMALIELKELVGKRIAVELNQDIVPKSRYSDVVLNDGDSLEIVHAIGGG